MQCKLRWIVTCRIENTWIHFESRSTKDHSSIRWMQVVDSRPLFDLNENFLQCLWTVTAVQIYWGCIINLSIQIFRKALIIFPLSGRYFPLILVCRYHICAREDGKDSCQGDSGGPLFTSENGR